MAHCAVLQTYPFADKKVGRKLREQGFEYYNPKFNEKIKLKRGGVTFRRMQLFLGYMFVWIESDWFPLKSTPGVIGLLMSGDKPAAVPNSFIEALRARENEAGNIELDRHKFHLGQSVQVQRGPFAYELGLYDGQSPRDRACVLLRCLGASRRIEMDEDNLVAA